MTPSHIQYHRQSRVLEVTFADATYQLPAEYLRVYSPSAEVRGHGNEKPKWVAGKSNVAIKTIEPQGNYAIRIHFDDGHNSGIYSWRYLHELGDKQEGLWQDYLNQLNAEGKSRDPFTSGVKIIE